MIGGAPDCKENQTVITVDARMAFASGIGTYIRAVLPEVFRLLGARGIRFQILHDPGARRFVHSMNRDNPLWTSCSAPVFSFSEHRVVPAAIKNDSRLLWVPHFNIPLTYTGRLAVTIHDVLPLAMPEFLHGFHRRIAAHWLFHRIARHTAGILCDSQFTADELIRLTGVGASRLHVIPLGIDERWFAIAETASPRDRPYFLFVGNVKPHKNLPRLLAAFEQVGQLIPHDLVIVGRKEGFRTGDRRVERLAQNLGARVSFTGHVSHVELEQYYAHATALVFPSLYEGFGLPAIEAMAAGCPVIAARAGSLPEVCGNAAIYCDPMDPADICRRMVSVGRDDVLRRELIERGRERAACFSWERCAVQTADVLTNLVLSEGTARS